MAQLVLASKVREASPRLLAGVASSSWPWHPKNSPPPENCRCLTRMRAWAASGAMIARLPCSQPVPWCFVDEHSGCPDKDRGAGVPTGLAVSVLACVSQGNVERSLEPGWGFY